MKTKLPIILFLFLFSFTSCNNDDDIIEPINCTTVYIYGLNVKLIDASNSNVITTNVEVKATDGNYEEILMTLEGNETFSGAGERAGNYTLTITSSNYQTYTSDVIAIDRDVCHVIGQSIEISLTPN